LKDNFFFFKDQSECFIANSQSQEASSSQSNSQTNSKPQKKTNKKQVSSTKTVSNILTTGQEKCQASIQTKAEDDGDECMDILIYSYKI
jgi:hypothetical protein